MIATVLSQPATDLPERTAIWRQLVDVLAQGRAHSADEIARAYDYLRAYRDVIPGDERLAAARSLAGMPVSPGLLAFFAEDSPAVSAPLITSASLSSEQWLDLLPRLSPTARSLLRHRRDLPHEVRQALESFGTADMVLEDMGRAASAHSESEAPAASPAVESGPMSRDDQIRALVERIAAYRKLTGRKAARPDLSAAPPPEGALDEFHWETGPDGVIIWTDADPRGALIGRSIASLAKGGKSGVDGQAAGAFRKRAPFRDARLCIEGDGPLSGGWRISGVPCFDPRRGHFLGYRGSARRPRIDEVAHVRPDAAAKTEAKILHEPASPAPSESDTGSGLFGTGLTADSLRELIHEVRTPLNAIIGFAEMIEGQYLGPAASPYRNRAGEIMAQSRHLLAAVDDLDTAARIETRHLDLDDSSVDAAALLARLHEHYARLARQRGSSVVVTAGSDHPHAAVESGAAERMFSRLLAATIGLSENENIVLGLESGQLDGKAMLRLSIGRPRAISGVDESSLLDPGYSPEGDWPDAPALGLGFALRLIRNLAHAVGGALVIGEKSFSLYLPISSNAGGAQARNDETGS